MRVCHFEDYGAAAWEPLTITRPVFDLLCGRTTLAEKQGRHFAADECGAVLRPCLADIYRLEHAGTPVNDVDWLKAGPTVLVNGRWLPPAADAKVSGPCVGVLDDEVVYAVVGREQLARCADQSLDDCMTGWQTSLPNRPAGGRLVRYLWELVELNARQLAADFATATPQAACVSGTLTVVGPSSRLSLAPTARVEPYTVADTTRGPVVIDHDAVIASFSRLEGPCYVGPHTHVLGAKLRAGTTLGAHCRVGGEIEASILHGYVNKYHDGFLGHSYVGAWVNFGAGSQNSDLRHDYGEVTVSVCGRPVATGHNKVGCFLGDHTKVGLGALLNTGTTAGVFCNLLPSGSLLPRWVPSFASWWNGRLTDHADLPQLLHTAAEVMDRRGRELTDAHTALYLALYAATAAERRRALRDAEQRRLRRSA